MAAITVTELAAMSPRLRANAINAASPHQRAVWREELAKLERKAKRTKPPTYSAAIAWIALNDEQLERNPDVIAGLIATALIADLFGKEPATVAADIVRYRNKHCGDA